MNAQWTRTVLSVLAGSLAATVVACGSSGATYAGLQTRPEANLFYPGSQVLNTRGQSEQPSAGGTQPALVRHDLASAAPIDDIYAWYLNQLKAKGWTLQKTERVNGNYHLFTRGDRDVFQVGLGTSPGTYNTTLTVVPAPCTTTPPTVRAFANCG